jgi:hypothetical protein
MVVHSIAGLLVWKSYFFDFKLCPNFCIKVFYLAEPSVEWQIATLAESFSAALEAALSDKVALASFSE